MLVDMHLHECTYSTDSKISLEEIVTTARHLPYDTERSGYYNVTGSFMKNLGIHFAIGYPF